MWLGLASPGGYGQQILSQFRQIGFLQFEQILLAIVTPRKTHRVWREIQNWPHYVEGRPRTCVGVLQYNITVITVMFVLLLDEFNSLSCVNCSRSWIGDIGKQDWLLWRRSAYLQRWHLFWFSPVWGLSSWLEFASEKSKTNAAMFASSFRSLTVWIHFPLWYVCFEFSFDGFNPFSTLNGRSTPVFLTWVDLISLLYI